MSGCFTRPVVVGAILLGLVAITSDVFAQVQEGPTPEQVAEWRTGAEQGDADAQTLLAIQYVEGRVVSLDYAEAVRWFRLAVEQGHAGAQTGLGFMYELGWGVEVEDVAAATLYQLAAEQGFADAQFHLARRYADGRGVARDEDEARRLFRLAAEQGHPAAQGILGVDIARDEPVRDLAPDDFVVRQPQGRPELQQSMFVSVIRRGEPVLDLTADEFIIEEDGERREVLRVERSEVPVQVAILIDDSEGFVRNLSHIRNGLNALLDGLPEGQQIAFLAFGDQMRTIVDYTSSKARLREGFARYRGFSETSAYLLNAVTETAVDLDRRGAIRPIIILITSEGGSNSSSGSLASSRLPSSGVVSPRGGQGLDADQVLSVLRDRMVAVHSLIVRGFGDLGLPSFSNNYSASTTATRGVLVQGTGDRDRAKLFEQLPTVTGGAREELGASSAVPQILTQIANDITNQYLVTYARPVGLVPPEEIEVRVTRRRHRVRGTPSRPIRVR